MKLKNKFVTLLLLSAGAATVTTLINKIIKLSATSNNCLLENKSFCYHWRFGKIHYTKCGSGKPLLLVHDLNSFSSGYEWSQMIDLLKHEYTVYTIDLLGFGRSEKPNLTYTNYLYVQLLTEFIKSEIGHRTDMVITGESTSLAIMSCNCNPEVFDKIMIINPVSITSTTQIPNKYAKFFKAFLDMPILGTLVYNIAHSKKILHSEFSKKYFFNPYSISSTYINAYYESSQLGESPKSSFASVYCNYTKCNIISAVKKIDHSIYLVGGGNLDNIEVILKEYRISNPAIEYCIIQKTKHLPQLETPQQLFQTIKMFFS